MSETIVEINQGKLKGKIVKDYKDGNYFSFQNIPYAIPPVGDRRFKSPAAPDKWEGIRDATEEGNTSLSFHVVHRDQIIGSEDCLYLNVYTPELPTNKRQTTLKPVMFWIHGGGFVLGSGNTDIFGPEYLITGDVVVVTINYRLGILGFLSLKDSSLNVPGNAGLKDMVQALKWVQENIKNFGGDPNSVTIFGDSAGAAAAHFLLLSPLAKGLFHRAILISGCALNPWVACSLESSKIAQMLNLNTKSEKELLEYLKNLPAEKFIEMHKKLDDLICCDKLRSVGAVIENPFSSSSEPNFLTKQPLDIIMSGDYYKVPVIIGYADMEGIVVEIDHKRKYGSLQVPSNLSTKIPHLYKIPINTPVHQEVQKKVKEFYFGNLESSLETANQYFKLETDILFYRGIFVSIREHLKNLHHPIYFYRFSLDAQLNFLKKAANLQRPGACHSDILGYLFKTKLNPTFDLNSLEGRTVEKIITLWTNFAKTSNPNSKDIGVKWDPVQEDRLNYLEIGSELKMGQNPDIDRMKFWDKIAANPNIKSKF